MNEPLVYRLSRQWHCRVAMFGMDNRWKHLSGKPTPRWGIIVPREIIWLIGTRWKRRKVWSRGVLIERYSCVREHTGALLRTTWWRSFDLIILRARFSRECWMPLRVSKNVWNCYKDMRLQRWKNQHLTLVVGRVRKCGALSQDHVR